MRIYRHGDLLIREVASVPSNATKVARSRGRIVLAEGEVTGHEHAIAEKEACLYELVDSADVAEMRQRFIIVAEEASTIVADYADRTRDAQGRFITPVRERLGEHVENAVALVHEEHATIMLPPGDYEVIRQVEYTPSKLMRVVD